MWLYVDILQVSISCFISCYNIASKFVYSNSIARACFIFLLCTLMTSANKSLKKKIFHWVENVIKQVVHQYMKHLGSLESTQEARVALGYASSNSYTSFMLSKFLRASHLDERMLTHELIVNCSVTRIERAYNISSVNPLTSKILLVILLIISHTVLVMLVWRIWYWIIL